MPIGPFEEKELAQKLSKISISEIESYHTNRMKKYRLFTRIAFIFGFLCIIFWFIEQWLTLISGIIGFSIITYTSFAKNRWLRLYENFIYFKRKGDKNLKEQKRVNRKKVNKYNRNRK